MKLLEGAFSPRVRSQGRVRHYIAGDAQKDGSYFGNGGIDRNGSFHVYIFLSYLCATYVFQDASPVDVQTEVGPKKMQQEWQEVCFP